MTRRQSASGLETTSPYTRSSTEPRRSLVENRACFSRIGVSYASGALGGTNLSLGWVSLSSSKTKLTSIETVSTSYGFAPSADFFVGHSVTVGGRLSFSRLSQRSGATDQTSVENTLTGRTFAPRVGYAIPIHEHIVLATP